MTKVGSDQIFLLYALVESGRALNAYTETRRLATVREKRAPGIEIRENQSIFNSIRMSLHFSANVSKVFWPPSTRPPARQRGTRLRQLTGIRDDHPLSSRKLRDHIEHLDERLDTWTAVSPRPFIAIENVLHADVMFANVREIVDATMIAYMEVDHSVHLLGERFLLDELRNAVLDVQADVSKALTQFIS